MEITAKRQGEMQSYSVDYETYYDSEYSVRELGPYLYAIDPRADAYLVSIWGEAGLVYCGAPAGAPWAALDGHRWLSHNAEFEQYITIRLLADGVIPAGNGPSEWLCTAALSVYLQAPRDLAGAARELLGLAVDKGVRDRMKGVRWGDLNEIGRQEVLGYAETDAQVCYRLFAEHGDKWPVWERELAQDTIRMGMAGLPVDYPALVSAEAKLGAEREAILARIPWAKTAKPTAPKQLAIYCRAEGIPAPTTTDKKSAEFADWCDKYAADHPVVYAIRDFRTANNAWSRVKHMLANTAPDGCMRYGLKYHESHAGRWSGGRDDG